MQSFCVYIRHIPGTKNLVADWLSRMVAALFGMSVEVFVQRGAEFADISCLMSMMIFTEEELEQFESVSTFIPDYVEEEGMFRPSEFTPDFEDALEELWNSRNESVFQDGRGSSESSLGAIPRLTPPERILSTPGFPSRILKRSKTVEIQEPSITPFEAEVEAGVDTEQQ